MSDGYQVRVAKSTQKDLAKIPDPWQTRIVKAIDSLVGDPFYGEKMLGKLKDKYKIRIWPYRIIYAVNKKQRTIDIVEIGHRGNLKSYR
ncbi:MAG: type II toxin-antitoxin system RelE/ParE family toxin [Patescibacteria group bacterium]